MAKAKEYGIAPDRIHIDPLVEMLCTSEDGIATNIETITSVREQYPTIHITAAISNISFNLPVRKLINYGFLVLAMIYRGLQRRLNWYNKEEVSRICRNCVNELSGWNLKLRNNRRI